MTKGDNDIHVKKVHRLRQKTNNLKADELYPSTFSANPTRTMDATRMPGQLQLSIYINYGHLTIHVIQARMVSGDSLPNGFFVKLSLVPDETKRTRCETDIVEDTNDPVFDEKFSFELLDEDSNKRILISLWNGDHASKIYSFCGCMSFGVKSLIDPTKECVSGWYCLLAEEVGRRKHLHYSGIHKTVLQMRNIGNYKNDQIYANNPLEYDTETICLKGMTKMVVQTTPINLSIV
ncbi:hypothetical protein ScPMuIL_010696 [Solemya velum]